jgi:glucokinase
MEKNFAIGTDIGGSHITCAAVDLASGTILRDTITERKVDAGAPADDIIYCWAEALSSAMSLVPSGKIKGIGFAMPGPFDYVKGICYIKGLTKYENLYGMNITDAINMKLSLPDGFLIRYMNDASSFAVGEAWAGSAMKAKRSLSITLGTGFGSAFISNRIPIVDGPEVPKLGCVYHLPYKGEIVEESISTRWFLRSYKKLTGIDAKGVKELADLAKNDPKVKTLFSEFGENLGIFLAPWLTRFKAEILVIGGNISYSYNLFGKALVDKLREENCNCEVAISQLKEDAALLGSAYLLDDDFWKSVQHALPLM